MLRLLALPRGNECIGSGTATVDRESDGRFIASIPDLGDLAAYGDTDKVAVAARHRASGRTCAGRCGRWSAGSSRRHFSEMPSHIDDPRR